MDWTIWIAPALAAVPFAMAYRVHNRLAALDERCNTAFADIDVHLKHRHTLIPSLVETVRGYAGHESELVRAVASSHAKALEAGHPEVKLEAEAALGERVHTLIQSAQQYPHLKASEHFNELRAELTQIENRVTIARRYYNLTVDELNATLRQFPGNVIGRFMHLGRRKHFDLGVERVLLDEAVAFKF